MNKTQSLISIHNLTKDYGDNRGLFNLDLNIKQGEVFGLVGQNGAGKTTIMRLLMGFLRPTQGNAEIKQKDVWQEAAQIKKLIGYVPGQIDFPDTPTGTSFLKMQMSLLKNINNNRINNLIQIFKIDTTANLKRMSKGMKQKMALVYAFMTNAPILLLDEPTTGLDPVMRDAFINLILECKKRGTTIIMSSHMFNELEPTCDRIGFLKEGKLIDIIDKEKIKSIHSYQNILLELADAKALDKALAFPFSSTYVNAQEKRINFTINNSDIPKFINLLPQINLTNINFEEQTLDQYFKNELHTK